MDLYICGLIDIILVLGVIIFFFVGYKTGFIKKVINIAGVLVILIFSVVFCSQFAEFLTAHNIIYPNINDAIYNSIVNKLAEKNISADSSLTVLLHDGVGIPQWISNLLANAIESDTIKSTSDAVLSISSYITGLIMVVISFFILFIGLLIIIYILKKIADGLRKNGLIRFVDGVLGALFSLTIYSVVVLVLFCIMSYMMDAEWFSTAREWLIVDMQLDTDRFRISKIIYNGNILTNFLNLFF